jgi:hypothetical protein
VLGEVRHEAQRVAMQVAVATRGAQDRAGRIDRRTAEYALADGAGKVDAQSAYLANGSDTGL